MTKPGIPGLRAVDHVGLVVPDLAQALALFVDGLGAELAYLHGPYRRGGDPSFQQRQFARHSETEVVRIAMVRLGMLNLELMQFTAPDQRTEVPRTSDLGGHHLALYVDDIHDAIGHLRDLGVNVLGAPMPLPGPEAGSGQFVFTLTPWGLPIELISYPEGKAYDATGRVRLFDPRQLEPWRAARMTVALE